MAYGLNYRTELSSQAINEGETLIITFPHEYPENGDGWQPSAGYKIEIGISLIK